MQTAEKCQTKLTHSTFLYIYIYGAAGMYMYGAAGNVWKVAFYNYYLF